MKKIILICILFCFFAGCLSIAPKQKSDLELTRQEIDAMLKNDNLTPTQKVILRHASVQLKDAQQTIKENIQLEKKVIKESKAAGVGKFMYWIIAVVILGIIAFIVCKIKKILPI